MSETPSDAFEQAMRSISRMWLEAFGFLQEEE